MTCIAPQFYEAFCAVNDEPIQLYCTWHADKAFKEQMKSKIKYFAIEVEVYNQLRIIRLADLVSILIPIYFAKLSIGLQICVLEMKSKQKS